MVRTLCLLLFSHELRVDSFGVVLYQRLVVTDLHNFPSLHYNNLIGILDSGKSMSDDYGGNMATELLPNLVNCCLHLSFVGLVKSAGCFIKQKNLGLLDKCSCNS